MSVYTPIQDVSESLLKRHHRTMATILKEFQNDNLSLRYSTHRIHAYSEQWVLGAYGSSMGGSMGGGLRLKHGQDAPDGRDASSKLVLELLWSLCFDHAVLIETQCADPHVSVR